MQDSIEQNNKEIYETYQGGMNHKGQKLHRIRHRGHTILAFNKAHAENIYQQLLIDLRAGAVKC